MAASGVVLEATATWKAPSSAPCGSGLAVHVVNPRQVRDFARAIGQLAKRMRSMRISWRSLGKCCDLRLVPCRMRPRKL